MSKAPRFLLDTNILADLVRHPQGPVFQQIQAEGEDSVATSIIVACELRFGAAKKQSVKLSEHIEIILGAIPVLPFEIPADRHYGKIRHLLAQAGTPIGPNDLLIAAHALHLGVTLVTANQHEFARVPNLRVANWLGHNEEQSGNN